MVEYKTPPKNTLESAACGDDIPEPTILPLIAILNGRDSTEKYQISFLSLSLFLCISFFSLRHSSSFYFFSVILCLVFVRPYHWNLS